MPLGQLIDHQVLDAGCPRCSYPMQVIGCEVTIGVTRKCPACYVNVRFVNDDGSFTVDAREAERELDKLIKALEGLGDIEIGF